MANHKSAAKRTLQNEKRRLRNRHVISTMRGRLKELRAAIEEGNADQRSPLRLLHAIPLDVHASWK